MLRALLLLLAGLALPFGESAHAAERLPPIYKLSATGERHAGKAMVAYQRHAPIPGGMRYGDSVRKLDLTDLTATQIHSLLVERGFKREITVLRSRHTNRPLQYRGKPIPLHIYTHRDGGTVRVKPEGMPSSKLMPQPSVVKALRWPFYAPGDGFANEALKVDRTGRALPRFRTDLRVVPGVKRKDQLDAWAHRAHTDLVIRKHGRSLAERKATRKVAR